MITDKNGTEINIGCLVKLDTYSYAYIVALGGEL